MNKCPKCEISLSEIKAQPVSARDGDRKWKGAVYTCPHCDTILGAGLDPLTAIEEIVRRVKGG